MNDSELPLRENVIVLIQMKDYAEILMKLSSKHFVTIILVNSPINVQQTIENCGPPSPFQNDKPSRGAEGESRLSELCIPVIDLLSTPCSHN